MILTVLGPSSCPCTIYNVAARVRRELQGSADAAINFRLELLASIVFNNNHGRSLPTLCDSGFCLHAAK